MEDKFERYLNTYSGRKLRETHSLDQEGTWQILGEDPNCDFIGAHHQPNLGVVQGKLRDVVAYGVDLPGFWQWGGGGKFELITVRKIDTNIEAIRRKLLLRQSELNAELTEINEQLMRL